MESTSIDRRKFIGLGAASIAGAAALSAFGCAPQSASTGTKEATSAAGTSASSGTPSFAIAPAAIEDGEIAETIEAEVVVIGAGMSGLCTAWSAIEAGGKVAVVSASAAPVSRGGSNFAANSKLMKANGVEPCDIPYMMRKEFMAEAGGVNMSRWARYFQNTEKTMDWLIDIMDKAGYQTTLECTCNRPKDDPFYTPPCSHAFVKTEEEKTTKVARMQEYVVKTIADLITSNGGTIDYGCVAKQLVRGGKPNGTSGRVDAVIVLRKDGTYAKYVGTKAVVMATGDFSLDREMMETYCPEAVPLLNQEALDAEADYDNAQMGNGGIYKGDGHKMGLWVGAAWQHNLHNCPMYIAVGPACTTNYNLFSGLLMNADGKRFMNEDVMFACGAVPIMNEKNATGYAIWDDDYASYWKNWQSDFNNYFSAPMTEEQIRATWSNSFDTIEEAIKSLNLPEEEAKATIDRYNQLCDAGEDSDFFKPAEKLHPIRKAPFHTGTQMAQFLTVLGGLRTDDYMRVCDEDDKPIEGLYNVGSMSGDFYGGVYTFMIEGMNYGQCRTFGYLTGRYIMENEK